MLLFLIGAVLCPILGVFYGIYGISGLFFGIAVYYIPTILERKAIVVYNRLIQSVSNQQLANEYYEDTSNWIKKTFHPNRPSLKNRLIKLILIAFPFGGCCFGLEINFWFQLIGHPYFWYDFGDPFFIEVFTLGTITFTWLFYWLINLYVMFYKVTYILHHYTFWPHVQELHKMQDSNFLGKFFTLNLFFWVIGICILGNAYFWYCARHKRLDFFCR